VINYILFFAAIVYLLNLLKESIAMELPAERSEVICE